MVKAPSLVKTQSTFKAPSVPEKDKQAKGTTTNDMIIANASISSILKPPRPVPSTSAESQPVGIAPPKIAI